MTVLTMRYLQGHFVVSGPDIEPIKFKTRREARAWCARHYPGSLIRDWRRSGVRNVVLVRHDRGLHRGFVHSRHYGSDNVKKVVVRHTPTNRTLKAKTAS
jgi:hypothetical protein